jgi:hypothetical protein
MYQMSLNWADQGHRISTLDYIYLYRYHVLNYDYINNNEHPGSRFQRRSSITYIELHNYKVVFYQLRFYQQHYALSHRTCRFKAMPI